MLDLEALVPRLRGAWMAGRSALEHCPPDWRAVVGAGAGGDVALAALVAQAAQVAFRPAPAGPLKPRPLLPKLAAPLIAESLRPQIRRLLAGRKGSAVPMAPLLMLLAARGVAIHPADWLPGPRDEWAPALYAPWLDWANGDERRVPEAALSIDSYDEWPWAERRAALAELRRRDPGAAREIIAAKAAAETAERRAKLIEILQERLSDSDASALESFAGDRSDRVKALARGLLARLGKSDEEIPLAAELAETVEFAASGFLKRRKRLIVKPLKTGPQKARRRELFSLVTLAGLARAMGAEDIQLVETAPEGEAAGVAEFAGMVAATGSERARRRLLESFLDDSDSAVSQAPPLADCLPVADRLGLLPAMLLRDDPAFENSLAFAGPALGGLEMRAFAAAPGWAALLDTLRLAIQGDDPSRLKANAVLPQSLRNLGLLATAGAARDIIATCVAAGLSAADPRLDMLRLNAALRPEIST